MARKLKLKSRKVQLNKSTGAAENDTKHTQSAYGEMIQAALTDLNSPKGVSSQEILQLVIAKYSLVEKKAQRKLSVALSNGVKRGIFIKIRSAGSNDLYGLKKEGRIQHKLKTKKTAARAAVKEQFPNPDIERASIRLSKPKPPKFSEMVEAALANLKQRKGSSRENILKYLLSNYSINENTAKRNLSIALKTGTKNGMFVKVDDSGGSESYKLARNRQETKTHKTQEKTYKRKKGERLTSNAGKQVSEMVKLPHKGIDKFKLSKRSTTDRTHAAAKTQTNTIKATTTDVQQESRKNRSEYKASSLSDVTISLQESIFVKIPSDDQDCQIVGLDITPDGRMVMIDGTNKKLKLFDRDRNCLSYYNFQESKYGPVAVSVLNNNEVIVSIRILESLETHLHIIDIEETELAIKHVIPLFGHLIRGLATYQDKIFISGSSLRPFEPAFVRLINKAGQTIWSTPLIYPFALPDYLSCFSVGSRLNVIMTDPNNGKIMKLNGDTGKIEKEHIVQRILVKGTSFGKGVIYVCNCGSQDISAFDANLDSNKTLFHIDWSPVRPIWSPVSIKYDELDNRLLVSKSAVGEANNYVECFKVES